MLNVMFILIISFFFFRSILSLNTLSLYTQCTVVCIATLCQYYFATYLEFTPYFEVDIALFFFYDVLA